MRKYFIIRFITLFSLEKIFSQEISVDTTKVSKLDEVILTATRTQRQLSSLPLPVNLISKKQIVQSLKLEELKPKMEDYSLTSNDFDMKEKSQLLNTYNVTT